jgi:hypothetical protein
MKFHQYSRESYLLLKLWAFLGRRENDPNNITKLFLLPKKHFKM